MPESLRRRRTVRRLRRALRLAAIGMVVVGPIVSARLALHAPPRFLVTHTEVDPSVGSGPAVESVRAYVALRDPAVDRLLPAGEGGTRFFRDLDGKSGMAFLSSATIGLAVPRDLGGWPEATELHERAHLLHAFVPGEVGRLLARLPAPEDGEYAATNRHEHLAEMAAAAWEIVVPPDLFCVETPPADRLREAEARVPGTAGFVQWYLRNLPHTGDQNTVALLRTAAELAATYQSESDALWETIDTRRLPGGDFQPWGHRTVRDVIEAQRAAAVSSGRLSGRVASYLLLPSLAVLSLAGR